MNLGRRRGMWICGVIFMSSLYWVAPPWRKFRRNWLRECYFEMLENMLRCNYLILKKNRDLMGRSQEIEELAENTSDMRKCNT
jgi:hypothetical protein